MSLCVSFLILPQYTMLLESTQMIYINIMVCDISTDDVFSQNKLPISIKTLLNFQLIFPSLWLSGPKRHNRKSMLLSELCVVAVSIPADLGPANKGKGSVLNFRFQPHTRIEFLRVAILKVRNTRL